MTGWKEEKLENIFYIVKEVYKPSNEHQYKYVGLEHIEQGTLRLNGWGYSNSVQSNKYFFKKDDILFGKLRPYFRKVIKAPFDGVCSTDIWVCRAKKDFDQNFLFYFLANQEFIDTANSTDEGTRMPRADWNYLKKTTWIIPPLPEQKAIAEVLSSLDDKIDLLTRQNKTLEDIAQAYFRKWFIEDASDKWEEKGLDEIADFLNGLPLQKYPYKIGNPLHVIKIKELNNGFTDSSDLCSADIPEQYIVHPGDVIFSWSGSLKVDIWKYGKGALNQHLFKVTSCNYPKWFYYFWIKYHLPEFKMIAESKATTMGHIQRKDLSNAIVLVPDGQELNFIDNIMSPLIEKIEHNNAQVLVLQKLRDTLLPKLISGEVRVNI
jgi:type I restriction enzyme S subunit